MYQFSPETSPSLRFQRPENFEWFPRPERPVRFQSDKYEHVAPILAAAAPLFLAIGAGIRWLLLKLWGRKENEMGELRQEVRDLRKEVGLQSNRIQMLALHGMTMSAKLRLTDPGSPELEAWDDLIHQIFPLDAETPMSLLEKALRVGA